MEISVFYLLKKTTFWKVLNPKKRKLHVPIITITILSIFYLDLASGFVTLQFLPRQTPNFTSSKKKT